MLAIEEILQRCLMFCSLFSSSSSFRSFSFLFDSHPAALFRCWIYLVAIGSCSSYTCAIILLLVLVSCVCLCMSNVDKNKPSTNKMMLYAVCSLKNILCVNTVKMIRIKCVFFAYFSFVLTRNVSLVRKKEILHPIPAPVYIY